ncbi:MAG: hypothetical protein A2Y15_08845 [Clostridiales bacterium GWF2_36_10]|nr:MAG: hypothetical protein A2Y15_08845 [Clostridiales bacterium GWF2_36_10]HAN20451.1 thioredoxin [Clostridiales bacterium]
MQIGIPVFIIILIAGIFIFKSINENKDTESVDNMINSDNAAVIPLSVKSIDLVALKEYKMPIIIDFGADECIPCKEMYPVLKKLNTEMQSKAVIQFVDVWKNQSAVGKFPVTVIPTQFFFNSDGTPYVPSANIQKTIELEMHMDLATGKHNYTSHQGGLTEAQLRQILAEMGVE